MWSCRKALDQGLGAGRRAHPATEKELPPPQLAETAGT